MYPKSDVTTEEKKNTREAKRLEGKKKGNKLDEVAKEDAIKNMVAWRSH